ncbi:MAG TPA: hypothetical protein PK667_06345 [Nitrosomonas europaea]|uniref:hypothetical protein n=1 Tax=Nitrosomonas TaxID=914 RepID=UPI002492AAA3|nr:MULTISPECIES: hypothetical protein [Nitrosomonas]MEB2331663.1 hypothetical protein [Nitrosomonas sp.]HRO56779.1 hypothetical protein [Nitrosomonas europaea]HUM73808.1 hypothetical protein [Nitrosomonas europaea]
MKYSRVIPALICSSMSSSLSRYAWGAASVEVLVENRVLREIKRRIKLHRSGT